MRTGNNTGESLAIAIAIAINLLISNDNDIVYNNLDKNNYI